MMASLNYDNFVVNLAAEIDRLTNHFVFDGYHALASLLRAPLGAMIVLYITLVGYAMVRGLIQSPQQEFFKFSIRSGLIYMTAMNWDFFASYVRDLFVVGSESIAITLMQSVHQQALHVSLNQGLQGVLNELLRLGGDLLNAGSFRKLTPYFAGMMVLLSGSATIGLAFMEMVIAKVMLSITLCTAPLFIIFTLFEQTKSFFERWLGIVVGFSLVLVFVSSVVGLCVHLLHWVTTGMENNPSQLNAAMWVPLFIVSCLCVMCITQAAAIGKSIGGALCTSGGAEMVGSFIKGGVGALMFSKNMVQQHMRMVQHSAHGGARLLKMGHHSSGAVFKYLQQHLRRGTS